MRYGHKDELLEGSYIWPYVATLQQLILHMAMFSYPAAATGGAHLLPLGSDDVGGVWYGGQVPVGEDGTTLPFYTF